MIFLEKRNDKIIYVKKWKCLEKRNENKEIVSKKWCFFEERNENQEIKPKKCEKRNKMEK